MTNPAMARPTLTRKLLLLGALPAIVMFIVLIAFFTSARLQDARQQLSDSSQMFADSLAPVLEYAVVSGNSQALEQVLLKALKRSKADWIEVTNVSGDPIGFVATDSTSIPINPGIYDVFDTEILQQPLDLDSGRTTEWFTPESGLRASALRVGTVHVGVSRDLLADRQRDIVWTSLAVGASLLLFTMLIMQHHLNTILNPVRQLSGRISRLINRDYAKGPTGNRSSAQEVADIEQQLNELATHLANLETSREQTLAASESARQKAESANQAKSEFLATMSHELRTPLNGVLGMIDLVQEDPLTPRQRDYLTTARQSTEDLLTVISDILDFSRMESGVLKLSNQEFDLENLIRNCTATYRQVAEERGLSLSVNFFGDWPDKPLVIGDAPRLRQIIAGLIDNAIKFTSDGSIIIQAGCFGLEDHCIVLNCAVSDSGSGIPIERLPDIFNSFEQLQHGDDRSHGGTGLGLALVQRLVELMGGHIKVETDLGRGSSFRFELPFELAASADAPPHDSHSTREPRSGVAHALVVEDNLVNQRVAKAMLTKLGYQADAANNGKDALQMIRNNHRGYDVILMDCQMPVMDGYETTRRIREWEQSSGRSGTPIIALTADVLPGTDRSCLESGMNDYVAKPVRKEKLKTVLGRWIPD
ncbi:ATP-binding protein [Marinobacter apostichopi]|uniref:ATP-binding protein n=1 Tax=Marinobacter apostichopi TaxID=3035454 RepID=UPI002573F8DA|nr:ATP-binding protein [Marinobacter sp. LA51]